MKTREGELRSSLSQNKAANIMGGAETMKMTIARKLDKVIEQSFALLGNVLEESDSLRQQNDYRLAFIYRHSQNIFQLGDDVIFLLKSERFDSCQFIVRAMLESLFKLIASVKQPETAIQILVSEVEADIERMKLFDPLECEPGIKCSAEFAAKLRKEYNITSKKKWSAFECADAADLIDKYRGDYFVFSGRVHASTGGIIMQEKQIGAGHALQTLLFIVIYAAAGFAQVIQTKTPQYHVDESARLLKALVTLIQSGIFKELDADLDER
jgi:hypothetical protein